MWLLVATIANARKFTKVFIEYLKSLSVGIVSWLSLTEEAKMENRGFLVMATTFVWIISFLTRNHLDIPTNPDYIPSVSVAEERRADLACARFESAQRRDMQKKDKEREAEQHILVHQQIVPALHHDQEKLIEELPREIHDTTVYGVGIPVEVGKFSFLFVQCITIILHVFQSVKLIQLVALLKVFHKKRTTYQQCLKDQNLV